MKNNTEVKVWPFTYIVLLAVLAFWAFKVIPAILEHEKPRLEQIRQKHKQIEPINPKTDTPVIDVTRLTPEQLGLLDVGLSLDNLSRTKSNKRMVAARKMQMLKKHINKEVLLASIPRELPRSMRIK